MPGYFVVFGKTPALSAAELVTVLKRENLGFKIDRLSSVGMVFSSDTEIPESIWSSLGGSIKAGDILTSLDTEGGREELEITLEDDLTHLLPSGRINLGYSIYPLDESSKALSVRFNSLGAKLKADLVAADRSVRHVTSTSETLSAVTVRRNKLLTGGREYCLFVDAQKTFIGATTWVQDYEEFARREFERPAANARSGMVPVKLARMLVNLAGIPMESTLIDPFCGSGTVPVEALALGQTEVIASDISKQAVDETEANIAWLRTRYEIRGTSRAFVTPVDRLLDVMKDKTVDAVVTEPFLGPPLRGQERREEITASREELENLYMSAFGTFAKMTKPGASVVFIFPMLPGDKRGIAAELLPQLLELGFENDVLVPERWRHTPGFDISEAGGIIYSRSNQKVRREIMRFHRA